jgi:hypothetical protein
MNRKLFTYLSAVDDLGSNRNSFQLACIFFSLYHNYPEENGKTPNANVSNRCHSSVFMNGFQCLSVPAAADVSPPQFLRQRIGLLEQAWDGGHHRLGVVEF